MPSLTELLLKPGVDSNLVKRLHEKRRLLETGDDSHKDIKTALIVSGGGMRGAYSTGITAGLEELGYGGIFDNAVGISAGACAAAYLLAGQAAVGPSVYYEDLPNRQFINLSRPSSIMDIGFLEHVFRDVKPLNQRAVRLSRTEFYIGLTELATGNGVYMNVSEKTELDIISVLMTSSAIPGVVKQREAIDGVLYVDGTTGCTNPIDYAVDSLGATDILVVLNYPPFGEDDKLPISERLLSKLLLRNHPAELRNKHLSRLSRHNFKASKNYADTVNIGVICPTKQFVSAFSKDSQALKKLSEDATAQVKSIFKS